MIADPRSFGLRRPTWDADTVKAAILPHLRELLIKWGIRLTEETETAIQCHAIGREDKKPSAAVMKDSGVYTDSGTGTTLSLFYLAVEAGAFAKVADAINGLGQEYGVPPSDGTRPATPLRVVHPPVAKPPAKPKKQTRGNETYEEALAWAMANVKRLAGYEVIDEYWFGDDRVNVRLEKWIDGKRVGKEISPFHCGADGRWRNAKHPEPYAPYGIEYLPAEGVVQIYEGEKCRNIATQLRMTALAIPFGSPSTTKLEALAGRDVAYVLDAGEAGLAKGRKMKTALESLNPPANVRLIELPGLADNEDIEQFAANHADARKRIEALIQEAFATGPVEPQNEDQPETAFTNYRTEEYQNSLKITMQRNVPLRLQEIRDQLQTIAPDWPKRIGETLFIETPGYQPVYLNSPPRLFAWLDGKVSVDWTKGSTFITQERFYESTRMEAPQFESIETVPHTPRLDRSYYMHQPLPEPTGALDKVVDMFTPYSAIDRELIKAAILTPLWGGQPGSRPAVLLTGPDHDELQGRGVGKTSLMDIFANNLYGGSISLSANDDIADVKTRCLSPDGLGKRILRGDNIKTHRFSWADLEDFITCPVISGRALYVGEGRRPNTFTVFLTLNGASLSSDMAQRVMIIKLRRPTRSPDWQTNVEAFVRDHKWEILADADKFLASKPGSLATSNRWATWENNILSKLANPTECQAELLRRQASVNDDDSDRYTVREYIAQQIKARGHAIDSNPFRIPSLLMAEWVSDATRTKYVTNKATTFVKGLCIKELIYTKERDFRGWVWCSDDVKDGKQVDLEMETSPFRR